jgi:hypothetical protein
VAAVRSKLKQFPEIVKADIDLKQQLLTMEALPSFDQYVALEHGIEDGGGAIQMFHPQYLVPRAYYAAIGVKERTPEAVAAVEERLRSVPGVRFALIDRDRWFKSEKGIEVGGSVVFADPRPGLELDLIQAAKEAGFIYEAKSHGGGGHGGGGDSDDEWSELNHAFAGLCVLTLAIFGLLQITLSKPPGFIKYGTVFVWAGLFIFLFVCADRNFWPLGKMSWWDGFREWDTTGHRIGTALVLLIGLGDFARVKGGYKVNPALSRWGMLSVGIVGSTMLYTHFHRTIDPEHYFIATRMNIQHFLMATTSLGFALSKFAWDTWQVPRKGGQYLWLIFLLVLGIVLTMYVE